MKINMDGKEFLSNCRKCELSFKEDLSDFFNNYVRVVEKIYNKYHTGNKKNQNRLLSVKLVKWLENGEYTNIITVINSLNETSKYKVLGFIDLYNYVLESTDVDHELLDQLFFIPKQFEKDCKDV